MIYLGLARGDSAFPFLGEYGHIEDMETHILNPVQRPIYECGARLLATILFPGLDEDQEREKAFSVLCAHALKLSVLTGIRYSSCESPREEHLELASKSQHHIKRLGARLDQRLHAADVASVALLHHLDVEGLPDGTPSSLKDCVGRVYWIADEDNFRSRFWAPARPVLHLLIALKLVSLHYARARMLWPHTIYFDELFLRLVVAYAEPAEQLVPVLWQGQAKYEPWQFRITPTN
ncbi:hypothetical protein [Henriciella sp.]|uniref:hypothetical protein n=1 Tax=Henriciella sp. TaxID=1968823 RepID=UPI00260A7CE9|nr:hypothetical protein [Henriciella sp.]